MEKNEKNIDCYLCGIKRLTERDSCGEPYIVKCMNCDDRKPQCYDEMCISDVEIVDRLAEYEDTGLSPDDVVNLINENVKIRENLYMAISELSGDCSVCANSEKCKNYPLFCINGNAWKWIHDKHGVEVEK